MMRKTFEELSQEYERITAIENPWERAVKMLILQIESLLVTEENGIEAEIEYMKEYGMANFNTGTEYLESLIRRYKGMTDRRDQLQGKLTLLETIINQAEG